MEALGLGQKRFVGLSIAGICALISAGCSTDSEPGKTERELPATYEFESRFQEGTSVAYSGQTHRYVLIRHIDTVIEGLTKRIDDGEFVPSPGEVRALLESYYAFKYQEIGEEPFDIGINAKFVQSTFNDIATDKDLKGKFAGNGGDTEHKNWKEDFVGAEEKSSEAQLFKWFDQIDALCVERAAGTYARTAEEPVYVTADGVDLKQLIQKHLTMAVAYSQALDKYLDESLADADNSQLVEDGEEEPYSALEHAWDEAFGYFGAARDFGTRDAKQNAGKTANDTNGDKKIDLTSEVSFYHAVYAAKRESQSVLPTYFATDLWNAFVTGRVILAEAGDELSEAEKTELFDQRDLIRNRWEELVAANVVHYLNAIMLDLNKLEEGGFEFAELAAHFSEMKGFALGLQFSPTMRISDKDFAALHKAVGNAPVSPDAGKNAVEAYRAKLLEAREILAKTYGFAEANVGEADGTGGF